MSSVQVRELDNLLRLKIGGMIRQMAIVCKCQDRFRIKILLEKYFSFLYHYCLVEGRGLCVCVHLCGVFPGSGVLCNEVNADTSSMHRHRTPTGKKD